MAGELVLVVDDEPDILELVGFTLRRHGFAVERAATGEDALRIVSESPPEAIVLDRMLPGIDGMEVCRRLKSDRRTRSIPIIMLTAKGEESDVLEGLGRGADDYVTKPFSPKVLAARVQAVLRRAPSEDVPQDQLSIHGVSVDVGRHEVHCLGEPVTLSATEFSILVVLMTSPGWVFSRAKIIDAVRGKDYPVTERAVDVQILGLRKKLGACGDMIETVRGVGYRCRKE